MNSHRTRRRPLVLSFMALLLLLCAVPRAALAVPSRIAGRVADRGDGSLIFTATNLSGGVDFSQKSNLNGDGSSWHIWYSLGGVVSSQPVTVLNANGKAIVLARGADNRIYYKQEVVAGSNNFDVSWSVLDKSIPAPFMGEPAAVRLGDGRLAVFATSINGAVYQSTQATAGGSFGAWTSRGSPFTTFVTTSPVVAINGNGALSIFARCGDNGLWLTQQTSAGGSWGAWSSLGGTLQTEVDPPVTVDYDFNSRLVVATTNSDGYMISRTQLSANSTSWTAWTGLNNGQTSVHARPALARHYDGRLMAFFWQNTATNNLLFKSQTAPGANSWSSFSIYTTELGSSPVAFSDANGIIHLFILDSSGYLHESFQTSRNSNTFSDWWAGAVGVQFAGL